MLNYTFTQKQEIILRNLSAAKRKEIAISNHSRQCGMSTKTKDFIQKICYRKTASIDMTRYGFINDRKLHPVNLLLKPLRAQLEKICGTPSGYTSGLKKPVQKKVRMCLRPTAVSTPCPVKISTQGSSIVTVSALCSPGPASKMPHQPVHRVTMVTPPNSAIDQKAVKKVKKKNTSSKIFGQFRI